MVDASTVEVKRLAKLEPLWLTAIVEGRPGPRLLLGEEKGKATVGRAAENDVVVEDRTVSSRHLEVELVAGGVRVRDLGAKNRARFQGSEVTDALVPPGAVLRLGGTELRIERAAAAEEVSLGPLRSRSRPMQAVIDQLSRIAPTDATVLVEGETGTGKEVAARALHGAGARREAAFTAVDCGALPHDLAYSELFGHLRGAFTGADRDRPGA